MVSLFVLLPAPRLQALDLDFLPSFSADYFDAGNWTPSQVPTFSDDAYVRNSGTPQAWSGGTVQVNSLTVGDVLADGDGNFDSRVNVEVVDNLIVGGMADSQEVTSTVSAVGNFFLNQTDLLEVQSGNRKSVV